MVGWKVQNLLPPHRREFQPWRGRYDSPCCRTDAAGLRQRRDHDPMSRMMHFDDRSVTYDRFLNDLASKVAYLVYNRIKKDMEKEPEMVSTAEAAAILKISQDRMRRIKDRFPHIKQGDGKQGKLLFVRNSLLESYQQS